MNICIDIKSISLDKNKKPGEKCPFDFSYDVSDNSIFTIYDRIASEDTIMVINKILDEL